MHREQQKAKRMLEERLKITTLEERLKTEMMAAGGQLDMSGAEALRQAMQVRLKDVLMMHFMD